MIKAILKIILTQHIIIKGKTGIGAVQYLLFRLDKYHK